MLISICSAKEKSSRSIRKYQNMPFIIRDFSPKSKVFHEFLLIGIKKPRIRGVALQNKRMLLLLLEQRLVYAAERTDEIIRQILEGHTRSQIVIGISHSLIIDPPANCTNPCLHGKPSFIYTQNYNITHRCIGKFVRT